MFVSNLVSKDKIYFQQETIMHMKKKLAKSNISKMPGAKTSIITNMIIYIIYMVSVADTVFFCPIKIAFP